MAQAVEHDLLVSVILPRLFSFLFQIDTCGNAKLVKLPDYSAPPLPKRGLGAALNADLVTEEISFT